MKQNLIGHSDAITSIFVCRPYSIVVTGSEDSVVIIWDLNRCVNGFSSRSFFFLCNVLLLI